MLMKSDISYRFLIVLVLSLLFSSSGIVLAQEKNSVGFSNAKDHWTFLGGYGVTHPGLGDTETRLEEVDLILQYGYFLSEEKGKSWYKTRHELLIEIPIYIVYHPETAIMTGVNFLACWDFTASDKIVPYVFAGGGFVYTNVDSADLGTDYNGNYQGGIGIHYFIKDNVTIDFNYRYHHISNAGTSEPNEPLNSTKMFLGLSFLR